MADQATLDKLKQLEADFQAWKELLPELEKAQETWDKARDLLAEVESYYFEDSQDWMAQYDAYEEGEIEGNFEILSQDAIYDAHMTMRELAIAWMRMGLETIE